MEWMRHWPISLFIPRVLQQRMLKTWIGLEAPARHFSIAAWNLWPTPKLIVATAERTTYCRSMVTLSFDSSQRTSANTSTKSWTRSCARWPVGNDEHDAATIHNDTRSIDARSLSAHHPERMKRQRQLLSFAILVLACGALLILLVRHAPRPTYEGKTVAHWFQELTPSPPAHEY